MPYHTNAMPYHTITMVFYCYATMDCSDQTTMKFRGWQRFALILFSEALCCDAIPSILYNVVSPLVYS